MLIEEGQSQTGEEFSKHLNAIGMAGHALSTLRLILVTSLFVFSFYTWYDDDDIIIVLQRSATEDILHAQELNVWYRYAQQAANVTGNNDCYVCTHIPVSNTHPTLFASSLTPRESDCIIAKTASEPWTDVNTTEQHRDGTNSTFPPCSLTHPIRFNLNSTLLSPFVTLASSTMFPYCYARNGSVQVGQVHEHRCRETQIVNPPCLNYTSTACVSFNDSANVCPWVTRNATGAVIRRRCRGGGETSVPSANGTTPLNEVYWMCGTQALLMLPPNWGGVCAPVTLSDHTYILSLHTGAPKRASRSRRSITVEPHDSIGGSNVPAEFKLWSTADKVVLSLFPQLGVAKVMLRVETLDYRFGLFLNATMTIEEAQNREIDQVRTMVLQNRWVLDLLTAAAGGSCVLLNHTSCCTYITDEIHSKNATDAMGRLRQLQKAISADHRPNEQGWFTWLMEGGWMQALVKIGIFMLCALLILCILASCIVPCLRSMITKMVSNTFVSYELVMQKNPDDDYTDLTQGNSTHDSIISLHGLYDDANVFPKVLPTLSPASSVYLNAVSEVDSYDNIA